MPETVPLSEPGFEDTSMSPEDRAREKSDRAYKVLLGALDEADAGAVDAPEPAKPHDDRLNSLIYNKDLAEDLAYAGKPRIDQAVANRAEAEKMEASADERRAILMAEAAKLEAEAASASSARSATTKRSKATALKQTAAAIDNEIKAKKASVDGLKAEANEMANQVLRSKEANFVGDENEARYLAERENALQRQSVDARKTRVQVAEQLVEKANAVGLEARKDYAKVSQFLANEIEAVTNMLANGEGAHHTGLYENVVKEAENLGAIRPDDQLEAAQELKKMLECQTVPVHQQLTDEGHTAEIFYQSDRPGSERLLVVERWDRVTGKLISLDTLVYKGEPRRAEVDKLRPWRDPVIKLSFSIEEKMAQLRELDRNWRTQPGNGTRNEAALMTNMASVGTYPSVMERYNPHTKKKPPARQGGLFSGWFSPRRSNRAANKVTGRR